MPVSACLLAACVVLQSWKEWAWARAASPQEGGHQDALCDRGDRPRRPGEHALPGLLPRQGETDQRPAVWGVSEVEEEWEIRGEGADRINMRQLRNCQFDEFFCLTCLVMMEHLYRPALNQWALSWQRALWFSPVTTRKRWSTSCCWTVRRGIPARRTRTCRHAMRLVCQSTWVKSGYKLRVLFLNDRSRFQRHAG